MNFVDPWGLKITCTEEDSTRIIELLNELSGNSLDMTYNAETGAIEYKKKFDSQKHVGQTLVSDLLDSSEIVNVNIGYGTFINEEGKYYNDTWCTNTESEEIEIYIDLDDELKRGMPLTIVNNENGEYVKEYFPLFIAFGHELLHAWRKITGFYNESRDQSFKAINDPMNIDHRQEEFETMGINYTDANNNPIQVFSSYKGIMSENGLRIENNLRLRASYFGEFR